MKVFAYCRFIEEWQKIILVILSAICLIKFFSVIIIHLVIALLLLVKLDTTTEAG